MLAMAGVLLLALTRILAVSADLQALVVVGDVLVFQKLAQVLLGLLGAR